MILNRDYVWLDDPVKDLCFSGSFERNFFEQPTNSLCSCMRFCDWILIMYAFIMHIMCLIIFEEKAEIQDQHLLSLNRDRDRLQKYWANIPCKIFPCTLWTFKIDKFEKIGFSKYFQNGIFKSKKLHQKFPIFYPILGSDWNIFCPKMNFFRDMAQKLFEFLIKVKIIT